MKNEKEWEELKIVLLAVQKEFEDRNGRDSCKNCGMDYRVLIKQIEEIIVSLRAKDREELLRRVRERKVYNAFTHEDDEDIKMKEWREGWNSALTEAEAIVKEVFKE